MSKDYYEILIAGKPKSSSLSDELFGVEPRGIEPLYPNGNCEFLARGGPLNSTKSAYYKTLQKERPSEARTFRVAIESAIAIFSIAPLYSMSTALSTC